MTKTIVATEKVTDIQRSQMPVADEGRCYPAYDEVRAGKLMDELISEVKDDRANTKRVISADIASLARVQNQNERVIAACERELRRRDLSDERRDELLDRMARAAETTAYESASSRAFQRQQLDHSHKLPLKMFMAAAVIVLFGSIGRKAIIRGVV